GVGWTRRARGTRSLSFTAWNSDTSFSSASIESCIGHNGSSSRRNRHPLHLRRPGTDGVVPALDVRKLVQIDAVPLVARGPGIGRDVRNRVVPPRQKFIPFKLAVHHGVKPL